MNNLPSTNVCTDVGVHDVITCADLYDYRLRGLGVAGGQILGFSIDLRCRPYNTLRFRFLFDVQNIVTLKSTLDVSQAH